MELFQKKRKWSRGNRNSSPLQTNKNVRGFTYGLVDPPNRVNCIAKIGMKACTQSSRHLFPELFATDKSNYLTLSYKYNAGFQPE